MVMGFAVGHGDPNGRTPPQPTPGGPTTLDGSVNCPRSAGVMQAACPGASVHGAIFPCANSVWKIVADEVIGVVRGTNTWAICRKPFTLPKVCTTFGIWAYTGE